MWVVVTGWPQLRDNSLEDAFVVSRAGVYDGKSVRLFVNGKEVGRSSASSNRLTNMLPWWSRRCC